MWKTFIILLLKQTVLVEPKKTISHTYVSLAENGWKSKWKLNSI